MAHREVRTDHQGRVVGKLQLEVFVDDEKCAQVLSKALPNKGRLMGAQFPHKVLEISDNKL